MILGYPRPKYFFFGLPNLLPQKIRLPLISFFSGVSYICGHTALPLPCLVCHPKSFASKNQTTLDFFFLWSQLHLWSYSPALPCWSPQIDRRR